MEILGDAVLEPTEVFDAIISLDDDGGQPITLDDANATATITDNDASAVSISATTQAAEPNLAGVFTLSLTEAASEDTVVSYSVSGTASPDVDYVSLSGTVTIPAGSTVATLAVNVLDDSVLEGTETVVVTLTGTDNLVGLGTEMEATVNITDDDTSEVSVISDSDAAEPATDGSYTISLSNPVSSDTQIFYSIGGTAAPDTDYTALSGTVTIPAGSTSATLPVEVIDDNTVEGDESVILTLTATGNAVVLSETDEATLTLADDDSSAVTISATTLGAEPDQDGLFTFALSNPAAQPTTVSYTVSGSATAGADYTTLSGTIVVLAGATTATLPVEVLDDLQLEGDETVIVQLTGTDNDVSLGADTEAVITIADNEISALTVTVANDAAEPDQDGAFRFELTTPVAGPTTVSYSLDGSATADDDYVALSGTLIIPAGDTEFILPLNVVDDVWIEGTETAVLTLTGTDNLVNLGTTFEATMNIVDDDESSVSVTAAEQAGEPDADGQFELSLTQPVAGDTEVFYTVGGTATPDVDYDALSGTALFPAGSTSILLDIPVIDDLILEGDESVILTLTGTDNAVTLDAASEATMVLTDNDSSEVTVAAGMDASEPDNNGTFVLSLSNPVAVDTEISYSLTGSSLPDLDYTMLPGTVVIPAGSTSITIEVGVLDDTILEETETIEIGLTGTNNAVVLGGSSSASISLFDDDASVVSVSAVSDGAEPDSDGRFVLSLSNPVSTDTEVEYSLDGSAMEGVDYAAMTGTAILAAGTTSLELAIEVLDDLEIEGTETVVITLTQTGNAVSLGSEITASLDITDNDQSVVTVVAVADGSEPDQDGAFAILLDTAAEIDTEVTYTVSGTATADADYTALSGTLTLPAGTTRIELPVEVIDDDLLEFGGETVILTLTAGDGRLQIGDPSEATVRIADNEGVDAGIELIKTVTMEGDGQPGDRLLYTFLIRNTGNVPLEWIEIDDAMLSDTPIAVPGVLPAQQETTLTVEYTLTQEDIDAGSVTNSAFAFGTEALENTTVSDTSDNGIAEDGDDNPTVINMVREPALAIVKTATLNDENQDGFAQVGETIAYRFRITNTGNVTLTNVYVEDLLDGIILSGQPVTLAPGETDEVTFSALYPLTIDDIRAQQVSNQAQAFGTEPSGQVVSDYSDNDDTFGDTPTVTELSGCEIEIFNGVSPNIDGGNDLFFVQGIECYPNNTVEIYNRWGALIFEQDGYNNYDRAFTGISEGKATINQPRKLPDGTYFYIIRYTDTDGISHSLTGYLYINRR